MLAGQKDGKMARRYKKKRRSASKSISLVSMIPVAYVAANAWAGKDGGVSNMFRQAVARSTGFDPYGAYPFDGKTAMRGVALLGGVYIGKKLIAKSGVNRALRGFPVKL